MKRILLTLVLACSGICFATAQNYDAHLNRFVEYINTDDFASAAEQLSMVQNWERNYDSDQPFSMDVDKALLFLKSEDAKKCSKSVSDHLKHYISQACYEEGDSRIDKKEAIRYFEYSVRILKDIADRYESEYAHSLEALGLRYDEIGKSKKAESLFSEARKLRIKNLPNGADEYLEALGEICFFYYELEDYKKAEKFLLESLQVSKDYVGGFMYLDILETVIDFYQITGDDEKAKQYQSLSRRTEKADEDLLDLVFNPQKRSNSYDDYVKHKQAILSAILTLRYENIEDSSLYAMFTFMLGGNYLDMGDWKRAEECFFESAKISKKIEQDSASIATYEGSIVMLGILYMNMGDYEKAEHYLLQGGSNTSLGLLYREKGEYEKAEQYLFKALKECEEKEGKISVQYANCSNHIGQLYLNMHDLDKADQYLMSAYHLLTDSLHVKNLFLFSSYVNNIAQLCLEEQEFEKAVRDFTTVLKIQNYIHSEDHPDYIAALNSLGEAYFFMQDYEKADSCFVRARDVQKESFTHSIDFMSDMQRSRYWATVKDRYERLYPSFCYRYHSQKPSISSFAYDNELYTKGLLLTSSNAIRQSILESQDTILMQDWEKVVHLRNKLQTMQQSGSPSDSLTMIAKFAEEKEKEVTKSSVVYRENLRQWNITWDSVRAVLKPRQVAIEFMKVPLNMDSTMYCALLLRDTCSYPLMIPLFEENQVAGLAGVSLSSAIKQVYDYNGYGMQLSQIVWSKIQKYINRGDEVFFAPTGVLYQLAVENLPFDENHTMSDVYNMVRVSSTREIVLQPGKKKYKKAALYGDINYNLRDTSVMLANADRYRDMAKISIVNFSGDTVQRSLASNLPGTKKEIDTIQPILQKKKIDVTVYAWDNACEESFKALTGKHPSILHIATHGFFWDDAKAKKEQYFRQRGGVILKNRSIDPLDRCGLLFTGANVALSGHSKTLPEGVDDGILTAKEISNLDFRTTDIVVLSACETGLGDITGDGVFGLQRAFKMAGAQTILMTLWKVDDDATQRLMTAFYRHLSSGLSKRQAFRYAQQEVRNYTLTETRTTSPTVTKTKSKDKTKSSTSETTTTQPYSSPYFWAGFILLD